MNGGSSKPFSGTLPNRRPRGRLWVGLEWHVSDLWRLHRPSVLRFDPPFFLGRERGTIDGRGQFFRYRAHLVSMLGLVCIPPGPARRKREKTISGRGSYRSAGSRNRSRTELWRYHKKLDDRSAGAL